MELRYRLLNVFVRGADPLSGNALCVFEDASSLDGATMLALAKQFNLSETTFVLPSSAASARVRIFTPDYEMPFAGHPTLGTAHVVRALGLGGDSLTLEEHVGVIPVTAEGDRWQLVARAPSYRDVEAAPADLATALGLDARDVLDGAAWVNAGSEQLMIPLASKAAVDRLDLARIRLNELRSGEGHSMAYAFHDDGNTVHARFFFSGGGGLLEDPATGSACANLGGWFLRRGDDLPVKRTVLQGEHIARPSVLELTVRAGGAIAVAGRVREIGHGVISI
jgi:trans-2,3-dihydro-3-hydroxyanthranilate isomerase